MEKPNIAIIGAGMTGVVCARNLKDAGYETIIFEKSRGIGGRMATRRTSEGLQFDHGAQGQVHGFFGQQGLTATQFCNAGGRGDGAVVDQFHGHQVEFRGHVERCLLYTSPSPRD